MSKHIRNLLDRGLLVETRELALPDGDTIANFQFDVDVPVQGLMVGQPRLTSTLGQIAFRPVGSRTASFSYPTFGLERFQVKNAERPFRSEFQHSELRADKVSARLARFGWSALLDRDELDNADAASAAIGLSLGIREKHQTLARAIVELSAEAKRATVLTAAGSYSQSSPDLDVTLAGGSEWNHSTGGDSYASIRATAKVLAGAHGLSVGDIDVFLTHDSEEAAYEDPTFRTARVNGGETSVATRDELRRYWGVRSVQVGDGYKVDSAGTGIESLYGDIAILRISSALSGFDTSAGSLDSFVQFYWTPFGAEGRPLAAVWIPLKTSWAFPYEHWELPATVNTKAAAIIRNTHT
jgi:hypothetical protein